MKEVVSFLIAAVMTLSFVPCSFAEEAADFSDTAASAVSSAVPAASAEATAIPIFTSMPSEPAETMPQSTAAATGSPTPTETVVPSAQPSSSPSCTDPDMLVNVYRKVNGQYTAVYSGRLGDYTGSDAWSHIDYGDLAGLSVFNWADMDTVIVPQNAPRSAAPLLTLAANNVSVDTMMYNDSGYIENASGNTTFTAQVTNNSSVEKNAMVMLALYKADGTLKSIKSGESVTALANSEATANVTFDVSTLTDETVKELVWDKESAYPYRA